MLLRFYPYTLQFKQPFKIAHGMRTTTAVMFTEIEHNGYVGYGEASMPPYLGETHETASNFLAKVQKLLSTINTIENLGDIISRVDAIDINNSAAKAAVDIALHDLQGKIKGMPCHNLLNIDKSKAPLTFYTIGMDAPEKIVEKVKDAADYKILKLKLGGDNDKEIVSSLREATDKPVAIDVNQGWQDKAHALEMINWLHDKNILFVEQPLPKDNLKDVEWLTKRSPLPIIADEDVQRYDDIDKLQGVYHGVNIKLMKCTGMYEAYKMILRARELNMKVMIGCMSETSCAVSAAAQLSPLCDWADLDGPLLIKNNCFSGVKFESGRVVLSEEPGNGVEKINETSIN